MPAEKSLFEPLDLRAPTQRGLDWLKATDTARLVNRPGQGWWHGWGYGDVTGRMVEAFVLARQLLGETKISPEEERTRQFLESQFDAADGLSWRPESPYRRRAAHMFDQSSVLFGLVTWFAESGGRATSQRIERLIDALCRIAAWREDWCFYPLEVYTPSGWTEAYDEFKDGRSNVKADPCHEGGRQIGPLVSYYESTGYEKALHLAEGLARFAIHHSGVFAEDGSYLERESRAAGHVHSRLATAAGILKLGRTTGRVEWKRWAKRVLDWTLTNLASSFGWISERAHGTEGGCETCCIADALELAIALAEDGHPEYWDIVERFARNHLLESQCPQTGGFSGHSLPNDFCWIHHRSGQPEHHVGGCCSPAGIRGLWLVWERIITRTEDRVFVHLPLNRNSQWAEVVSELPSQGQIKVTIRDASRLMVRIPAWVSVDAVRLTVNDRERDGISQGRYIEAMDLVEGDVVVVDYPVRKERIRESFMDFTLDVTWRGNTVLAVEPPGDHEPLYRRSERGPSAGPSSKKRGV